MKKLILETSKSIKIMFRSFRGPAEEAKVHSKVKKQKLQIDIIANEIFEDIYTGADPEILERGGALCRSPWLAGKENCRFQMA